MKLRLNLSTTPLANKRPFLAATGVLAAVGVLTFLLLGHAAYRSWRSSRDLRAEISRWETEIHTNREKQAALESYFQTAQAKQVLDRAAFLNSLIGQRSFPWTKVFMDLEQILPPGVRVVNISPKLENGRAQVELTIGAESDESKIKFLQNLERSKVFSDIQVKDDRHSDQLSGGDKITVQLTAWYSTT
ncbi:MAG TPA: PilN domain-containing protein [Terriglobales bacterium]|jgi:Tfp pilus assembly protein PilN|nr:PilN domain-containing protein [Terriglobales bacterium]